jgi:hypothetical protein
MEENDDLNRNHSPLARIEKTQGTLNKEITTLVAWRIEHETNAKRDREDLEGVKVHLYGKDGNGGIFGNGGLDDKVKAMETTSKNLWKYILGTGVLVGILSNLDKIIR